MSEYSEEANRYIYGSPVQTSRAQYCHTLPQKSEEKAMAALEAGIVVTMHCAKRKPMNLTLCLRSQQTDLICVSSFGGKPLYTVDLYQVKEVITDPQARLARYSEEIINDHSELCISLFYGSNFMLNVITFVARSKEDFGHLHLALQASYDKLKKNSFYERKQRWLNREFQKIQMLHRGFLHSQKEGKINLKQIQSWLMQQTNTITRHYLALTKAKLHLPDNLELNHFANLLNELFKPNPVTDRLLKDYGQSSPNCQWKLTRDCFEIFLEKEQKEEINENVSQIMKLCLPLSACSPQGELCFSDREFEDYLYSEVNSILDPRELSIHQSMDFPLSCYWISSSHNTYLTGDQWLSEAHVETYVRCLQMGCRCLELDCWDGTDGRPIITHGKTFVSKIKLSDVLQTIKEHAWEASEYPLILSFENHCSLPQQRIMASLLKEIFKDDLLTEQIDINETQLPSPNKLMRKIIVKNKKLGGSTDTRNYVDMSA
ncbi:1-phosphatidylinositol 4,5-bisphosphate phosphodiesterase gamma-2 [Bulinus truncatus]|nr:1-phosphatidylinositol 4,5-bisphosphate phosphodiesterase gamma-2 [Bulinus truncatus]